MHVMLPVADASAAPLPFDREPAASSAAILAAANLLLPHLERGQPVDTGMLRVAMETTFGTSDASGVWDWKAAYEAGEIATVLFLRKSGKTLFRKAGTPSLRLSALTKIAALLPTHTRRSEESQALQQFLTPVPLGLAALTAAAITPDDRVLEPSAGTGLLAILAEISGGTLLLNELAEVRADLLASLFPAIAVTRVDAAQIDDHLAPSAVPSVVLMNPPFSALAKVSGRVDDASFRHIASALNRLAPGGRLVTITGANVGPDLPDWRDAFVRLQDRSTIVFSAGIAGSVYAKHGTTFPTRLTVIDKAPAEDPVIVPASPGLASDVATLLGWIEAQVPPRRPVALPELPAQLPAAAPRSVRGYLVRSSASRPATPLAVDPEGVELAYETVDWAPPDTAHLTDAIYEEYGLQSIRIPGSQAHPTKLVQSAAMASVAPPKPSYRPMLPASIRRLLSDAQLETVIYAGEAHSDYLAGSWTVDDTFDVIQAAPADAAKAVRFRRGFMLGDGTGAGKGRQSAGIVLDNWLRGRRKAVWISKSDKLLEDAQRDWSALGMERLLVTPLSRFPQGARITLSEGILFTTYATLRSDDRGERISRVRQIVEWLGSDFDGVIIFDESHAMQNAGGGKGERGDVAASQQGRAGLRLQHALPDARIVYVSATGATTVHNLAYAQRLGLWGAEDFPFATRAEFVEAIEDGGVAAMEVLARDLRSLGLYLPPVPGALDQIVQRFGTDTVAEVTGRSRRIVRKADPATMSGADAMGDRLVVENRAPSANLAETAAFMDDLKRVLVFSDAGGTGRSYHAELSARNRRLRVHYLLEPGWKADAAIQGLGRTNRTNQAQPPLFRPIATDVKAEKRFLSTIARRLDTLGAITRGQRQTGGQGLFRAEDNLESPYARAALRQLYLLLVLGKIEGCSLDRFEAATGLKLMDSNGIKDELPPITTFLNRLLALTIELQGILFIAFEQLLDAKVQGAIASGVYDIGLETLTAESFVVTDRKTIYTHPATGAETRLLTITERRRNRPMTLDDAFGWIGDGNGKLLVNAKSGRAAVQLPAPSLMLDDGEIERRVRLIRPMEHHHASLKMMAESQWEETDRETFGAVWSREASEVPAFSDSTIHVVAGLLLPVWKRLPNESTRVYRLQTDDGERIIGRRVSPAWAANATKAGRSALAADDAFAALMDGRTILDLPEGLQLRRVRVMGANRIELSGFSEAMRERLRTYGLFTEIISWKLRFFVPTDATGVTALGKLLETYPIERIAEREVA
ncbi:strawberry notch-like NTP hydrolase domain-containing protein [Agrobacterium vitis]|uniref:strawberry notch-like NTP hydrolase domain-containing protein n=1 Tax=Agrobacterium vitis TaxID=373 RepID=UPI003D2C1DDC